MAEIQLVWPNKEWALRASGETAYEWVVPSDSRLKDPISFEPLTAHGRQTETNVLAIGDGLDVLEALRTHTRVFQEGIRLVYIDPPFNTQVNFRQYLDTMNRSM